ncbi:MAG: pilus assembly protein TadG-related protein [Candidatus Binatia bacterium]
MRPNRNERGSVLVFVTLMIVLLMIMVGMGLDTGHLAYIRSQGQPAVDAAALAAASAIPTGLPANVHSRAAELNYVKGSNDGGNNYLNSPNNLIGTNSVTLINYNAATGDIAMATGTSSSSTGNANGVRVALEASNPYGGSVGGAMKSPLFLTPIFNLFGQTVGRTQNVSVSAVAVIQAVPGMPITIAGCAPTSAGCTGGMGTEASPYTNCKLLQVDSSNNGNNPNNDWDNGKFQDSGWTTFNIQPANAPTIKALVGNNSTCGNIPGVNIGAGCIHLNNGQITPVLTTFEQVYKHNDDGLSGESTPPFENDWGIIPVVSSNIGNFNQCEPVVSFAKFGIRDVVKNGSDKWLLGDLICNWDINRVGGTGCYTTRLVRDTKSGM